MGHKVHPKIFRIGGIRTWESKWFARRKDFAELAQKDILLREFLFQELKEAGVDSVSIERKGDSVTIVVNAAKPGVVIGRSGAGVEALKKKLKRRFFNKKTSGFNINIFEVKKPSLSARIVSRGMIDDLEKRMPFRRVMKQAIDRVKKAGAQGVKVTVSGRLNGAEIARTEKLKDGKVPLQNLRADIDYAQGIARTIYGCIGVKIWIYRGEIFSEKPEDMRTDEQRGM